jgi:hypothetical protein
MVRRTHCESTLLDVLDRILDKGMVIDVWARVAIAGLDLITWESRLVVASLDTYVKYAEPIGLLRHLSVLESIARR